MKIKKHILIIIFYMFVLFPFYVWATNMNNHYATEFKGARLQLCDKVFHKMEDECSNMICRDILVSAWAKCWKISMETELDQRLVKLKRSNIIQFHFEMNLQKSYNLGTESLCAKHCGTEGTMKGIPDNFCRIAAYKYRTAQAIQINKNQLTTQTEYFDLKKSHKEKTKNTKYYKTFSKLLCKMPNEVWQERIRPAECENKIFMELDGFDFTDDVCDLS